MNDLAWMDPPIEVAADSPRLEMIETRLKAAGLRPYRSDTHLAFDITDPLLIDLQTCPRSVLERVIRAAMIEHDRPLVLLTQSGEAPALEDAIVIEGDTGLQDLPASLAARIRRQNRSREARLRREVATAMGERLRGPDPDAVPQILYLGNGGPHFLTLQSTLRQRGITVTAPLTRHTARDCLSEEDLSAVIVELGEAAADYLSLCEENSRLSGLPAFMLTQQGPLPEMSRKALAYATETVRADAHPRESSDAIERLCRYHLASAPLRPSIKLGSRTGDLSTGLFSPAFLKALLDKQLDAAARDARPHTLIGLQGADTHTLGAHLRRLIRDTDSAARFADGTLILSLPDTTYRSGAQLARRIEASLVAQRLVKVNELTARIVERRNYHTTASLIAAVSKQQASNRARSVA